VNHEIIEAYSGDSCGHQHLPGGDAAGAAVQFSMLTTAGFDTDTAVGGLTAFSLLEVGGLLALPILALPAILAGVPVSRGLVHRIARAYATSLRRSPPEGSGDTPVHPPDKPALSPATPGSGQGSLLRAGRGPVVVPGAGDTPGQRRRPTFVDGICRHDRSPAPH
jgi:hypothetical protein